MAASALGHDAASLTAIAVASYPTTIGPDVVDLLARLRRKLHPDGVLQIGGLPIRRAATDVESNLYAAGFKTVRNGTRPGEGVSTLSARGQTAPHRYKLPLGLEAFTQACRAAREAELRVPPASFVIPVRNEAASLPAFLASLSRATNSIGADREFIFVLSGCEDASPAIVASFLSATSVSAVAVTSELGIVSAFRAGIASRTLDGQVGKLDSDTRLHPHTLDLLQAHLALNPHLRVTHAEPVPFNSPTPFSAPQHDTTLVSRRLYFDGKASLYPSDPFADPAATALAPDLRVEDIFFSLYYAYRYGLDSIGQAPHAITHYRALETFHDLIGMVARVRSELGRLSALFPPFHLISEVFDQEVFDPEYQSILDRAANRVEYQDGWPRLESTK